MFSHRVIILLYQDRTKEKAIFDRGHIEPAIRRSHAVEHGHFIEFPLAQLRTVGGNGPPTRALGTLIDLITPPSRLLHSISN